MKEQSGARYHVVPSGGGTECSIFTDDGREVASVKLSGEEGGLAEARVEGERWSFHATGRRRVRVLGMPEGTDAARVAYLGSSSRGVVVVGGEESRTYRLRNPWLRPIRMEDEEGETILLFRLRYLPRMRVFAEEVGGDSAGDRPALLALWAYLTVLLIVKPGLHFTTFLARPPGDAVARLESARRDPPGSVQQSPGEGPRPGPGSLPAG